MKTFKDWFKTAIVEYNYNNEYVVSQGDYHEPIMVKVYATHDLSVLYVKEVVGVETTEKDQEKCLELVRQWVKANINQPVDEFYEEPFHPYNQ